MSRRESIFQAAQHSPAVLCVFDVLVAGTKDMRERWQLKRKEWLREHLPEIGPVRWLGHVHQHGTELFAHAVKSDLEGREAWRTPRNFRWPDLPRSLGVIPTGPALATTGNASAKVGAV